MEWYRYEPEISSPKNKEQNPIDPSTIPDISNQEPIKAEANKEGINTTLRNIRIEGEKNYTSLVLNKLLSDYWMNVNSIAKNMKVEKLYKFWNESYVIVAQKEWEMHKNWFNIRFDWEKCLITSLKFEWFKTISSEEFSFDKKIQAAKANIINPSGRMDI